MTAAHIVDGFGRLGTRELQAVAASAGTGTKFLAERMDSPPKVASVWRTWHIACLRGGQLNESSSSRS